MPGLQGRWSSDYFILNGDFECPGCRDDGLQVTTVINRRNGVSSVSFFAEHSMNTANTILYICTEQIRLGLEDILSTNFDMTTIRARDFRFNGPGDTIRGLTIAPGGERHDADPEDLGPMENEWHNVCH